MTVPAALGGDRAEGLDRRRELTGRSGRKAFPSLDEHYGALFLALGAPRQDAASAGPRCWQRRRPYAPGRHGLPLELKGSRAGVLTALRKIEKSLTWINAEASSLHE